jgi:hypothetical protein
MKTKSKIEEKKLSKAELEAREKVMKDLKKNKSALVKRYGKDAEAVMYGRATNIAKKMAESENKNKIKEMVRKALMQEADIEVGADKYEGEKDLGQASSLLDDLEAMLKNHDWFFYMSDDPRVYNNEGPSRRIQNAVNQLKDLGYGEDAKKLYNQYAPSGDIDMRMKEGKKEDVDGDGDIDSKDYLAKRDAAIKKAKGDVKEDIDLGHEDNEPHMIKADLYRIGKYAMELYAMAEELEETGQEIDFPAWWQAMITDAATKMVKAKHYLDFELKEPAIDAAVDALTGEEPHMGEPEPPMMEGEVGKIDKLAGKIAKALKDPKNQDAEDQNNIKQARKAMNDDYIKAAEKLIKPYLSEKIAKKLKEDIEQNYPEELDGEYEGKPQKIKGIDIYDTLKDILDISNSENDFIRKMTDSLTDETSVLSKSSEEKLRNWYKKNVTN